MIGNSYQMVSEHDLVTSVMAPRLPLFNGDDPYSWVLCIEEYFQAYQTPESKKVAVAQACLEDVAWRWFQAVEEQDPIKNWLEFRITLFNCCSKIDNDPFDELMALRYEDSLLEFWVRFIPIAARLSDIPETFLCDMFIGNLPAEVKKKVREYKLRTLPEVIAKAFFVEGQLRSRNQTSTQKEELQNDKEQHVNLLESPTKMVEIKDPNHGLKSKLLPEKEVEIISSHQFILATKIASPQAKIELPWLGTIPMWYSENSSQIFPPKSHQARFGNASWTRSTPLLSMVAYKLFDRGKHNQRFVDAVNDGTTTISDLDFGLSMLPALHHARDRLPVSEKTCITPAKKPMETLSEKKEFKPPCLYDCDIVRCRGIKTYNWELGLNFVSTKFNNIRPNSLTNAQSPAHINTQVELINFHIGLTSWDPGKIHWVMLFWFRERQKGNRYQHQIDDNDHGWSVMKNVTIPAIALGSSELETTTILVGEGSITINPVYGISPGQSTPGKKELRLVPISGVGLKFSWYYKKEMQWMYYTIAPNTKKNKNKGGRKTTFTF